MNVRSVLSTIVLVALVVFVGVLWGGLTVMVKTLRAPDVLPETQNASTLIDEVRTFAPAAPQAEGGSTDLVEAAKDLGQRVDALKDLAPTQPELPPVPAPEPPAERETKASLARGDCEAASAAVLRRTGGAPDLSAHIDEVWDCFADKDKGSAADPDMAAALPDLPPGADGAPVGLDVATIQQGAEARLASYNASDALGFGPYLQDLMGAATLAKQLTMDLDSEASLAEWASVASPPSPELVEFFADRMKSLSGGLSGGAGEAVRLSDPEQYDGLQERMSDMLAQADLPAEVRDAWLDGMKFGLQDDPIPPTPPAAAGSETADPAAEAAKDPVDEAIDAAETPKGEPSTEECPLDEPERLSAPPSSPGSAPPDAPIPPPAPDDATPEPAPE